MPTQSIIFYKSEWPLLDAINWLKRHGYKSRKVDETTNTYRFRQFNPIIGKRYYTLRVGNGILFVVQE